MITRRSFLKRSSLVALAPTVPLFVQRAARAVEQGPDEPLLVVIQLDGGNDGINTVVPFRDEGYRQHRDKLRLPEDRLLKLTGDIALHPSLRGMADLFESGRLAIVQGVGYPNPNRSHNVSMAIWQTARFDQADHESYGWIGRALDESPTRRRSPASMFVGEDALPTALLGRRSIASSLSRLDDLAAPDVAPPSGLGTPGGSSELTDFVHRTTLDAYATADLLREIGRGGSAPGYPATELGQRLKLIARLIAAQLPTRVYYAVQSGYDTHAVQLPAHSRLLRELADALKAFLDDLQAAGLDQRVLVMCFSEFGRRVRENASMGTDHGTAGPVFLAGPAVRAELHGPVPSLTDLEGGDLKMSIDFRRVYATLLERWLKLDAENSLGAAMPPLDLIAG